MINILWDLKQGTEVWQDLRKDRVSATDAYDLLNGKDQYTILTEKRANTFTGSVATERGHALEAEARQIYAITEGVEVKEAGAILNSEYPMAMCSPDGVVGEDGLIEIKCFYKEHHEDAIENLDAHLIAQTQFQLLISERKWVDFVAYSPEEDEDKAFVVKRFYPDPEIQEKLHTLLQPSITGEAHPELYSDVMEIVNLESEIVAYEDRLSSELADYQNKKNQLETLKEKLKLTTTGKVKKTVEFNGNTLDLSIYDTHKVVVDDPSEVEDEFMEKVEVPDVFEEGGKFWHKVPNPKLVQNYVKAGKSLPKGFADKISRTIRLKFNGKSI